MLYLPPPRCCLPTGLINFDHKCLILLLFQVINSSDRPEDFYRRLLQDICLVLKGQNENKLARLVVLKTVISTTQRRKVTIGELIQRTRGFSQSSNLCIVEKNSPVRRINNSYLGRLG